MYVCKVHAYTCVHIHVYVVELSVAMSQVAQLVEQQTRTLEVCVQILSEAAQCFYTEWVHLYASWGVHAHVNRWRHASGQKSLLHSIHIHTCTCTHVYRHTYMYCTFTYSTSILQFRMYMYRSSTHLAAGCSQWSPWASSSLRPVALFSCEP